MTDFGMADFDSRLIEALGKTRPDSATKVPN
jgi:hypothetical protein